MEGSTFFEHKFLLLLGREARDECALFEIECAEIHKKCARIAFRFWKWNNKRPTDELNFSSFFWGELKYFFASSQGFW